MILPTKHLPVEASLLGVGAKILAALEQPRSVNDLWEMLRVVEGIGSFDRFCSALTFLYTLGLVDRTRDQLVRVSSS
jgi:hypothetical protein